VTLLSNFLTEYASRPTVPQPRLNQPETEKKNASTVSPYSQVVENAQSKTTNQSVTSALETLNSRSQVTLIHVIVIMSVTVRS